MDIKDSEEKWDSVRIIGRCRERFKELIDKGFEWRGFYTGWMEGRVDMLRKKWEIPEPPAEGRDPGDTGPRADTWLQERANKNHE